MYIYIYIYIYVGSPQDRNFQKLAASGAEELRGVRRGGGPAQRV